jgi:hypothetical protein
MSDVASVQASVTVQAPAERVWALVTDLPGMGALSPENEGGRWLGGASGPAVGARFRGRNANGWRRWSTTAKVTRCQEPSAFAFEVSSFGLPVSTWSYAIAAADGTCTVTETWTDRRAGWFAALSGVVTGVPNRTDATRSSIEATLAAVQRVVERG